MTVSQLKKILETLEDNLELIASFDKRGNILFPIKDLVIDTSEEELKVRIVLNSQGKWFSNSHYKKKDLFKS